MTEHQGPASPPPRRRQAASEPPPARSEADALADALAAVEREPGGRRQVGRQVHQAGRPAITGTDTATGDPDDVGDELSKVSRSGSVRWSEGQRRANGLDVDPGRHAPSLDLPPGRDDMAAGADDAAEVDELIRRVPRR